MKKLLAVVLTICLILSFAGCKTEQKEDKNYNTKPTNTVDIKGYVEKGIFDFSEVALSQSVDQAIAQFHTEADKLAGERVVLGENMYTAYKGLKAREIDNETTDLSQYTNTTFVYDINNEQNGIIAITTTADVYGFQLGVTLVEDVVNSLGEAKEYKADKNELYFLPFKPDATAVNYVFGENQVTFYFVNGFLSATVISVVENYDYTQTEEIELY